LFNQNRNAVCDKGSVTFFSQDKLATEKKAKKKKTVTIADDPTSSTEKISKEKKRKSNS
jgi:hypothetical protein